MRHCADLAKSLPVIAFGFVVAWMIFFHAQVYFQRSPEEAHHDANLQNPFSEAVAVGTLLREHSDPAARVAVIGSEPEIYFYAQRRSATGYIYTYALMESQPYALRMQQDMAREIETNAPMFLVYVPHYLSWLPKPDSPRYLADWFEGYSRDHYEKVGTVGFVPDGKLESFWGDVPILPGESITIFQRKNSVPPP